METKSHREDGSIKPQQPDKAILESETDHNASALTREFILSSGRTVQTFTEFEDYFQSRNVAQAIQNIIDAKKIYAQTLRENYEVGDPVSYLKQNEQRTHTFYGLQHLAPQSDIIAITDLEASYDVLTHVLYENSFFDRVAAGEPVQLLFLGDIVDRGPDALKVIEFFCWLKNNPEFSEHVHAICGNHEIRADQHYHHGKYGLFYSVVLDEHALCGEKNSLTEEEFSILKEDVNVYDVENAISFIRTNYTKSQCKDLDIGSELIEANVTHVRNRLMLYEHIRDLFDLLPTTCNAGGAAFISHTGCFNPWGIAHPASDSYSAWTMIATIGRAVSYTEHMKRFGFATTRTGFRYAHGNMWGERRNQAVCDLMNADVCSSELEKFVRVNTKRYMNTESAFELQAEFDRIYSGAASAEELNQTRNTYSLIYDYRAQEAISGLLDVGFCLGGHQAEPTVEVFCALATDNKHVDQMINCCFTIGKRGLKFSSATKSGKPPVYLRFNSQEVCEVKKLPVEEVLKRGIIEVCELKS